MRTFLERQHRQRMQSPGWDAQVYDFHASGCSFRVHGRNYSLIRSGSGFLVRCGKDQIWPTATYPDAALAIIYRHANQ